MSDKNLLVFVGTVGSGKSTQIEKLSSKLESEEYRVKKYFLKTGHLFAYIFEVLLAHLFVTEKQDVSPIRTLLTERPEVFKRLFGIWIFLDLISITAKFIVKIYIPLKLGYTLLIEEYIPAILADYIHISKSINLEPGAISFPIGLISKLAYLAEPMTVIYLDADTKELSSRWKNRGSRKEVSKYLQMQRSLLLALSKKFSSEKLVHVNTTNQTVLETLEEITKELNLKETKKKK